MVKKLSNSARVICGSVLMAMGYLPVFVGFFSYSRISNNSNSSSKCSNSSIDSLFEVSSNNHFDSFFKYLLQNGSNFEKSNLTGELLASAFALPVIDAIKTKTTTNKAQGQEKSDVVKASSVLSNSPQIIANGDLAGSKLVKSKITSNFYCDARRLGVPASVVDSVIRCLSSKIDFKRSLNKGDTFEIIYNPKNVMLYSKIVTKHNQAAIYRFPEGTDSSYYFENGTKAVASSSSFFGQPLRGKLYVTSPFGARVHPIRGVYQRHTGVDLQAPYGSPVYAIYDGVITRASDYYGYGKCVDVKHPSGYSSRYAHLSRYAVRYGMRVKKGQLIGYTGSTGISTGPHLHLELARNNTVQNPLSVKMMPTETPMISNLRNFNALKRRIAHIVSKAG